jgi:radical SAM superfamily enzyme YgiQ (UPF0313 family)
MVDDNFIGNKRNVKLLLKELATWQKEKEYPFRFTTEASIDLAEDKELIDLMVACNFERVFIGLETPDEDSLSLTKKFQNTRHPLIESLQKIELSGIEIMAGLIIGFDGEKSGAGIRILDFVEQAHIPIASLNMLQALPGTALWYRLEKEGRLLEGMGDINQTTLTNFIPTRPMKEIAEEYLQALERLYDPVNYLTRTYNHFIALSSARSKQKIAKKKKPLTKKVLSGLTTILWRQGIKRSSRWKFWQYLLAIYQKQPGLLLPYLATCAQNEHFLEYREVVKQQIQKQLDNYGKLDEQFGQAQTV